MLFDSCHGDVIAAHGCRKITDHHRQRLHLIGIIFFCLYDLPDFHGIFCDGSGLIYTEYIYSCQGFNTFHIVQQDFFLCQPDRADCQGNTCKKV